MHTAITRLSVIFFALAIVFAPMAARPAEATNLAWYAYARTTEELNLRSGPSTAYGILKEIPPAERVYVHQRASGTHWYKVTYGGITGYVHGGYLSQSTSPTTALIPRNLGFGYSDGSRVDRMIASIRPYSPLRGYGAHIANLGHYWGVDPLLVAQWAYETEMSTTGINSPTNPGNLTWTAAQSYASKYGCYRGPYKNGRYWVKCPSIRAGISLWFNYVAVRYRDHSLYGYFNTYNPCWDPYNTGQLCGTRYGDATLSLIRRHT
ncbi:MAG: SH3 domain-containing protein [Chloroflexota bacterium]|nr:SH3 domain-containing protein [Chloroflexota bacterium]